jgi:hypothetical protein
MFCASSCLIQVIASPWVAFVKAIPPSELYSRANLCSIQVPGPADGQFFGPPETGKMTPSAIILLVLGGMFEVWIVFAIIFAVFTKGNGKTYWYRVGDALKFQLQ